VGIGALMAGLAGGFGGALHAAGDSLAVFRLHFAALAVLLSLLSAIVWRSSRRYAVAALVISAALVMPTALSYARPAIPPPVLPPTHAVYQKNLKFRGPDLAAVVADIRASGAEIVTLQEVSTQNLPVLEMLRDDFPTQHLCSYSKWIGGPAVLSRWPMTDAVPICAGSGGMTALQLATPDGPVWAVSLHLHWPWPHRQPEQVAEILPVLAALEGPVIVAGDFNMVPWGASVRRIATAARAERVGATVTTLNIRGGLVPLPIDHVFLPSGWAGAQDLRPEFGSDHRGIAVRY
jgi:endonuclease/exonuclease/phosphatase (EEP) superfamily protein YafD